MISQEEAVAGIQAACEIYLANVRASGTIITEFELEIARAAYLKGAVTGLNVTTQLLKAGVV